MIALLWVAFAGMALTFSIMHWFRSKDKELPGPPAIPILGNILQMINAFQTHNYPFTYFAQKYGEIYRLKVPFDEIVILASYDAIYGVLTKEESMGRDISGIMIDRNYGQNLGIVFGNGQIWEHSRRWMVRNLREYGLGKSQVLQASVNMEIADFIADLQKNEKDGKQILQVNHTFLVPVSHIMYKMMAGADTKIDKETLIEMNRQTALMEKASGLTGSLGAGLAIYFPAIRYIFPDWTGRNIQLNCRTIMKKESQRVMTKAKEKLARQGIEAADSMTEKFVAEMNKESDNSDIFTEVNHDTIFADLFQASSNTTTSYLESLFLYLILYPDAQEKMYLEIQDTIPNGHEIIFEDKNRMVYTHAVMLEVHRLAKISQHLLPRRAVADLEYKNFRIKKNSMILADMNSLFSNPEIFEDPLTFKPERFIDSNGKLVNQKLIIPFGVGKRGCPGELFADVTAFLFFANFIRKFKLSTVPGEKKPKAEMHVGLTSCPHPFSVLMTRR